MLKLFKLYNYLVFCNLCGIILTYSWKGWHFLAHPVCRGWQQTWNVFWPAASRRPTTTRPWQSHIPRGNAQSSLAVGSSAVGYCHVALKMPHQ